jgi:aspartyl/asparaginyl-tRNA synthetase
MEEELIKIKEERDQLLAEVANLKSQVSTLQVYSNWTLKDRTSLKSIYTRLDKGQGLIGQVIALAGWIKTLRFGAKDSLAFIHINDGTTSHEFQIVVESTCQGWESIISHKATTGASCYVIGKIIVSQGKGQAIEMQAVEFRLLGESNATTYPLTKGKKPLPIEYLRGMGHFRPRTQIISSIMRVRNALAFGTHAFFQSLGYAYINTPLITASDCEGAGEMFQVTSGILPADGTIAGIKQTKDGKIDYSEDFFKKKAFLTVSGQLNAETYATAMGSVYTFGPTFRAENSMTTRHLAEFWMIEPEIAFADIFENMEIAEQYIKYVLNYALEECPEEFAFLENFEKNSLAEQEKEKEAKAKAEAKQKPKGEKPKGQAPEKKEATTTTESQAKPTTETAATKTEAPETKPETTTTPEVKPATEVKAEGKPQPQKQQQPKVPKQPTPKGTGKQTAPVALVKDWKSVPLRERLRSIIDQNFARVTYTDAISILQKSGVVFETAVEWGIDLGSEHERWLAETHFKRPTICYNYPKEFKAFYMRANEDGKTVAAMDILVPGVGELVGGSQREERLDCLLKMLEEKKLNPEDFSWYLELRKYGTVVHSGFGLGFERLVCYTTGIENIRDVIPFPRFPGHCEF